MWFYAEVDFVATKAMKWIILVVFLIIGLNRREHMETNTISSIFDFSLSRFIVTQTEML